MEPRSQMAKEKHLLLSNTMTILNKHTMKDRDTSFNRYLPVHSMLKSYILIRTQSIMPIFLSFFLAHVSIMHFQEMEKILDSLL